jgi:hypothetical protein
MRRGLARASNDFKVKRSEVVWNLHQADVLNEIGNLLGVEEATTSTPGWFAKRTPAIHNIILNLSPEEEAQLDAEVERIEKQGYPDEVKRKYVRPMPSLVPIVFMLTNYRLAEKYTRERVASSARRNWKEMGVMSVTFTAYNGLDGKLVIDA